MILFAKKLTVIGYKSTNQPTYLSRKIFLWLNVLAWQNTPYQPFFTALDQSNLFFLDAIHQFRMG